MVTRRSAPPATFGPQPTTLVRCPEGGTAECFYTTYSKVWAPEPLRRVRIREKKALRQDPWKDYRTLRQRITRSARKAVAEASS